MPLSAILIASTLGATSKATDAIDQLALHQTLQAHREILHSLLGADADRITQLFVLFLQDQLANRGVERS